MFHGGPNQRQTKPGKCFRLFTERRVTMLTTSHSFLVDAPLQFTFDVANKLENWPEMNPTCKQIEIISREGYKTSFRFINLDGKQWVSSHFVSVEGWFAYTDRQDPDPPIAFFQIVRTYRSLNSQQTEVREEVNCEFHNAFEDQQQRAIRAIDEHALQIQPSIKAYIEARYAELELLRAQSSRTAGAM